MQKKKLIKIFKKIANMNSKEMDLRTVRGLLARLDPPGSKNERLWTTFFKKKLN